MSIRDIVFTCTSWGGGASYGESHAWRCTLCGAGNDGLSRTEARDEAERHECEPDKHDLL